ncbi:hypothetical protein D3C85_1212260 [compost metagenome]
MRAGSQAFEQRLEEFTQLLELVDVGDFAGVEQYGLELGPQPRDPRRGAQVFAGETEQLIGQPVGELGHPGCQRATAEQQRPIDGTQAACLPTLQACRSGQADGTDQAAADVRVGKVDISIRHGTLSGR